MDGDLSAFEGFVFAHPADPGPLRGEAAYAGDVEALRRLNSVVGGVGLAEGMGGACPVEGGGTGGQATVLCGVLGECQADQGGGGVGCDIGSRRDPFVYGARTIGDVDLGEVELTDDVDLVGSESGDERLSRHE